jgi:hypothetical protein
MLSEQGFACETFSTGEKITSFALVLAELAGQGHLLSS